MLFQTLNIAIRRYIQWPDCESNEQFSSDVSITRVQNVDVNSALIF